MTRTEELRDRLLGFRPTDALWGWLGPLFFAVVGGILRFWQLGRPHQLVFDETYYVKQGVSMLEWGVEMRWKAEGEKVDPTFTTGVPLDVFNPNEGDMVVHPPVGKWIIAFGEWLFGTTSSFGWRFSVAVLGTVSILMIGRIARRLFGSTLLGTLAAFLLAFEGHHFVHSRTGLLDLILMFFALAAFGALLIDRDASRALLAEKVGAVPLGERLRYGPWLGWRPWRLVAGISLGLAAGTKWSGLYFLVVFGLMTVWWELGARRAAGISRWFSGTMLRDAPQAFVTVVGAVGVTYLASWVGWFRSDRGFDRNYAELNPPSDRWAWVPDALFSFGHYHQQIFEFHRGLNTPHDWQSNPWSWMIQGRPTSFFYEGPKRGVEGCAVDECSKAINSIGSVSIWWLATLALVVLVYFWIGRRDWRAGAILAGFAGGWLPWFLLQSRTMYTFYAVSFVPWVVLACVFVCGLVIGRHDAPPVRRQVGLLLVGAYCMIVLANFAYFWPIWTAQVIPLAEWNNRMWFPSWR
ncbi:dolichyl-phosphate-mannose--protein mannosyltransferase [Kribbia dieselivorans]|uniref:dolichyl-phosphate-mannose--protein mannosyltransferase n=1 Tax=Kribbia dieselivorans TaxID=331526 RepID=UPI000837E9BD|nr:phospholipid carrier-dependent glycosyltransferase [Kribbia dieselivorans]